MATHMTCAYCGRPLVQDFLSDYLMTGDNQRVCTGGSPDRLHHLERLEQEGDAATEEEMIRAEDVRMPAVTLFGLLDGARKNMWAEDQGVKELLENLNQVADELAATLPENQPPRHNHMTRDIKPLGQCPACDRHHQPLQ
jgi:hypothetical protein